METLGRSLLGGDEVYHLSGEVPGSSLSGLEAAPGSGPALLEYWIGAEDLLLRGARVVLEGGLPGMEISGLEVEVRFHGYGGDLDIPAPEAAAPENGSGGPGGVSVSLVCDRFLREELVFRADADTAERMDRVVEVVRSSHPEECSAGWRPVVVDPGPWGTCFGAPGERGYLVGDVPVPPGLMEGGSARWASERDSSNNVLVYWSEDSLERPSGGAGCWLFDSSSRSWSANRGLAGTPFFSLPRLGVWELPASGS